MFSEWCQGNCDQINKVSLENFQQLQSCYKERLTQDYLTQISAPMFTTTS